jgi:hypothetical protein
VLGQPWFGLFVAFLFYHKWTSPEKPAQYMNSSAGFPRLAVSLQPFRSWHIMTMLYQLPKDLGILPHTSIYFRCSWQCYKFTCQVESRRSACRVTGTVLLHQTADHLVSNTVAVSCRCKKSPFRCHVPS